MNELNLWQPTVALDIQHIMIHHQRHRQEEVDIIKTDSPAVIPVHARQRPRPALDGDEDKALAVTHARAAQR